MLWFQHLALSLLGIHLRHSHSMKIVLLPFCPLLIKLYKVFSSQTGELYLLCLILLELYHCLQTVDMCIIYSCYCTLNVLHDFLRPSHSY